ncbi:MAG: phosphate-starvation-inducible PsiE family protein [Desulfobacterales bacterium]
MELLETIKAYLSENVVHTEIVLGCAVALIAIARKVIILDVKVYDPLTIFGIAALIFTIAIAYLIKKCRILSGCRIKMCRQVRSMWVRSKKLCG